MRFQTLRLSAAAFTLGLVLCAQGALAETPGELGIRRGDVPPVRTTKPEAARPVAQPPRQTTK